MKLDFQGLAAEAFILQIAGDSVIAQQGQRRVKAATRQRDMLRVVLGATDDPRLVPHRYPHGLGLVELRILEGGQPDESVGQCLRQLRLFEVDQIGKRQIE